MRSISYEELEAEGYLLREDAKSIEDYAKGNSVMVSFRNAGTATLNQLKKGAAAKGHDILDKTIKRKSLGLGPEAGVAELNAALLTAMGVVESAAPTTGVWDLLGGFVASWNRNVPAGLYLSKFGYNEINSKYSGQCITVRDSKGVSHTVLTLGNSLPIILSLKDKYKDEFARLFYTGDYDMHDLVQTIGAGRSIIPSESPDETRIIKGMNQAMLSELEKDLSKPQNTIRHASMSLTIEETKRDDQEYQLIRHGAQVSYLAHMLAEEREDVIIYTVADKTHNEAIAAYSVKGGWEILDPVTELKAWYDKNSVNLKVTWKNDVHLQDTIAAGIANQVYREIRSARKNKISSDWLDHAIHACLIADKPVADAITALTVQKLTESPSGAKLRKTESGYETTVYMV